VKNCGFSKIFAFTSLFLCGILYLASIVEMASMYPKTVLLLILFILFLALGVEVIKKRE
jgi:hypothetical protein